MVALNYTKILVTSGLTADLSCPSCGKSKSKDVSKFINHASQVKLKYKCACQHIQPIQLERRRSVRKERFFSGHLVDVYQKGYHSEKIFKSQIIIKDLSLHGIRLKILERIPLQEKNKIDIEFRLDDRDRSQIIRKVKIQKIITPLEMGCEFTSDQHYGHLEKYFVNHF